MSSKSISVFSNELISILPQFLKGMFRERKDLLTTGIISMPQFISLNILELRKKMKMKDIATELNISLPAATGLIERLVGMGIVQRGYDERDRRLIYVSLTTKGKNVLKKVRETRKKAIEAVFGKLTEDERNEYLRILKKLVGIMKNENKK